MISIKFYDTRVTTTPSGTLLTLDYYLLTTISHSSTFYGIKVCSKQPAPQPRFYTEQVSNISNSMDDVSTLLHLCADHFVTPTDLITALDTLMNLSA